MDRKPVFDSFRTFMGGKLTQAETGALDEFLDRFRPHVAEDAFSRALAETLIHEGGYVNHPKDPGGRTNLGVTQRVWEAWTGKSSNEAEMRSLTREMVAPLYRKNYWDAVRADDMPAGIALCVFDFGVNSGPPRAITYLQRALSAPVDGKIGPQTIAAVKAYVALHGEKNLIKVYQDNRRAFLRSLGTFPIFGKGWMRRVDAVERTAMSLAR